MQVKIHITSNIKQVWKSTHWDWVIINFGVPIPPLKGERYNHLTWDFIWDIIRRRSLKTLLISSYFPESFIQANESNCPIIQLENIQRSMAYQKMQSQFWYFASRIINKPDPLLKCACDLIKQSLCRKVLLWGGIQRLPRLRAYLPEHTIAYSQMHYSYKPEINYRHYDSCDYLITQTRGQARYAFNHYLSLSPFTVCIPNGVETYLFTPVKSIEDKSEIRRKIGIPDDKFIVIFPSHLKLNKGIQYLEQLIKNSPSNLPDVFFLIVGDELTNIRIERIQNLVDILKNSLHVKWFRGIARSEMPDFLRAADACIMPAVCREGFSMAAIEAMATGLPLIASNAGFYTEIIRHEYNGLLCRQEFLYQDLIQYIKLLQKDQELARKISINARIYAEKRLSREKMLRNYDLFFEEHFDDIDENLEIPLGETSNHSGFNLD